MTDQTLGALIGLARACIGNESKMTEETGAMIRKVLREDHLEQDEFLNNLHQEKYRIVPDCAVCPHPCGNTDDYDISYCRKNMPEIYEKKIKMLTLLQQKPDLPIPTLHIKLSQLGMDHFTDEKWDKLIHQIESM